MQTIVPVDSLYRKLVARTREVAATRAPVAMLYVSTNEKTGASINVAIAGSCRPTTGDGGCSSYCYGCTGRISLPNSIGRQVDNLRVLQGLGDAPQATVDAVATQLAADIERVTKGQGWFRWHGVGDLLPGTVRVIEALARLRPTLVQWVVTRKPELAALLPDVPCVRILASTDDATDATRGEAIQALRGAFKQAQVRVSYARLGEPLPGASVDVVFNAHRGVKKLQAEQNDARVCPATLPGASHHAACDACRACFA